MGNKNHVDSAAAGIQAAAAWFVWWGGLGHLPGWPAMSIDLIDLAGDPIRAGWALAEALESDVALEAMGAVAVNGLVADLNRRIASGESRQTPGDLRQSPWVAIGRDANGEPRNPVARASSEAEAGARAGWALVTYDAGMRIVAGAPLAAEELVERGGGDPLAVGLALAAALDSGYAGPAAALQALALLDAENAS